MGEDRYRTVARSKPAPPPPTRPRRFREFWRLPRVDLFRTRRSHFFGLLVFFLVGTLVGVLFGPSSRPTSPPPPVIEGHPPAPAQPASGHANAERTPARVRAYAYTTPAPEREPEARATDTPHTEVRQLDSSSANVTVPTIVQPPTGTNPRIAPAAALPQWLAYAVPEPAGAAEPRIALVIDDLGIDQARTRRVIALPGPLTMAFLPYGYNLGKLSIAARAAGHELIVHLPMQPQDDDTDPGPNALLRFLAPNELRERIAWNLSRFQGFVGVNNHMGSGFTRWDDGVTILMQEIKGRGLLFLDSLTSRVSVAGRIASELEVPFAVRDVFLDNEQTAVEIQRQLDKLEEIARKKGYAIGIGHPHDATIETLKAWLPGAKARGLSIVPLSAVVRQRRATG